MCKKKVSPFEFVTPGSYQSSEITVELEPRLSKKVEIRVMIAPIITKIFPNFIENTYLEALKYQL